MQIDDKGKQRRENGWDDSLSWKSIRSRRYVTYRPRYRTDDAEDDVDDDERWAN